jgi:tetratricopeptide (TPR) repeat protein
VGRATELEKLSAAVDRLELGVGGIVFIVGEAGLGKSRLVEELRRTLLTESPSPVAWHETSSLSYETGQPYNLFQRLLRRRWDIPANAPPDTVRERLARHFGNHPEEEQARLHGIFEILFNVGKSGASQLEGQTFKRELFNAMAVLWRQAQPAVLVCDDLHWADLASIELLLHLFKSTERVSLLVVCAMRPDRNSPGWELKEAAARDYPHRYAEISLSPLTSDDTNALIDNLLTITNLPVRLRQRILAKTDGNPFFVEEVVRALIDREAIVPEGNDGKTRWRAVGDIDGIEIPGNLQSMLIARIDQLEQDARRILQLASVIGRSFYYRVLDAINQSISAVHADIDRQLIALQRGELIREAARVPELEYMFRHSLTQEAAYSTILLRQRREFHRQVGGAIEKLFPDRLEEFHPVLAHHFGEANDPRALRYATLAGDDAFRLFAIPEALEQYSRALTHAKLEPESADRLTHIYLRRGRCQELQSNYLSALQNYAEMGDLAEKWDDQAMQLAALKAQATAYAVPGPAQDAQMGEKLAKRAMTLARQLSDREAEAEILWIFMLLRIHSGLNLEGIPFGEQSVALARELGMRLQLAHSLQDLGLAYLSAGYLDRADAALAEARPLWEKLQNLPMLVENQSQTVYLRVMTVDFDEAITISEEALRIAQSIENVWGQANARMFVGLVHLARGEIERCLQTAQSLIAGAEKVGHPGSIIGEFYLAWLYNHFGAHDLALEAAQRGVEASTSFIPFRPLSLAMLARQRIRAGAWAQAENLLTEARQSEARQTLQMMDLIVDFVTVEYYLGKGDFPQAETYLDTLLGKLDDSGARYFLPDALHLKATSLRKQGGGEEALDMLREARAIAEQIESKITLWRILAELGDVDASREVVDSIAAEIADSELHRTFLRHAKSIQELHSWGAN